MAKKIFVLGAGYAGIETAMTLYKKKKAEDIEIYLVDKKHFTTPASLLHEVAGDRIDEDAATISLRDIFKYTDVKLIKDEIETIDYNNRKLFSKSSEYSYDYLVIASGSQPVSEGISGSLKLGSLEDAIRIREHVKDCFVRASLEQSASKREALLTFVIGGAGLSGTSLTAELAHMVKKLCKEYDMPVSQARIVLIEAKKTILDGLSVKNARKAEEFLTNKLKVNIMKGTEITGFDSDGVKLKSRTVIPTRTLILTAGVGGTVPAEKEDNASEAATASVRGYRKIEVDAFTKTPYPGVYAVGDVSLFRTNEYVLPEMATFALQTGRRAALNILADLRGRDEDILQPSLYGISVSLGSFHAVGNLISIRLYSFFAVILGYFLNLKYLFHIGGFELAVKYLKAEFLNRRHEKFLVEKHYSSKLPAIWLVPIRLFLGYAWLMEGIGKVNEGWFQKPLLAGLPADAQSGASVTESGEKLFRIVAEHTPSWYAWIANTIIIPNALIFQYLITITEIGLGIALITGTLTFFAGLVSIALNINFLFSTGMLPSTWWYFPAAFCMLGGAGMALGVDHYLMPYLMRQWSYFIRNKRLKLLLFH